MTKEQATAKIRTLAENSHALGHAMGILNVDGETVAPKESWRGRGRTLGVLSGMYYGLMSDPEAIEAVQTVLGDRESYEPLLVRECEVLMEEMEDLVKIPRDEYVAYETLLSDASNVWHSAKVNSDYAAFAPYLEKVVEARRRFAAYLDPDRPAYDVLLDKYEKGTTMAELDTFFAQLREKLTPVILAVAEKPQPDHPFLHAVYPVAEQRLFSDRVMALIGLDRDRCVLGEVEHPFTSGMNRWDVRITTHYHEDAVLSSMYSVIHEGGHAIYEMGSGDELQFTCLAGGATMGIHESQSRFYENLIGRSRPFCEALLPLLRECFPEQTKGLDAETLYRAVNIARPSLIRTEADELTYGMHVMIRYEMEKRMIAGEVKIPELPALWNEMYRKYLGVEVPDDRRGILQDSHWSTGLMGYFPSYALGSAYGAQMLHRMEGDIDVWGPVARGDLSGVTAWLHERIHRYGHSIEPKQILQNAFGAPFDAAWYTDYLTKKFTELYAL